MTDLDLEHLGDVWRQQPDPAELEELKRAAETVRRRARWTQVVDVLAALLVAGVVIFLVVSNPATDTFLVGGAAVLLLLVSQIRHRRLRQNELRSLTGSAEQMIEQSIERIHATLKRAYMTLWLMPVGAVLGIWVAYTADEGAGRALADRVAQQPGLRPALQVGAVLTFALFIVYLVRLVRRSRRELDRLLALRQSYREEKESLSE